MYVGDEDNEDDDDDEEEEDMMELLGFSGFDSTKVRMPSSLFCDERRCDPLMYVCM